MKTYVFLSSIVVLAIVSSVKSDSAYHKYLNDIAPDVQAKCYEEADLVADKDKLLADEMTVDPKKLNCYIACVYRETGAMSGGNILFDILEKQLDASWAGEPTIGARKEIIQECIAGMSGTGDCERVSTMTECFMKKVAEKGI